MNFVVGIGGRNVVYDLMLSIWLHVYDNVLVRVLINLRLSMLFIDL